MDLKRVKRLIDLMKKNDISELEIEEEGLRVRIKRGKPGAAKPGPQAQPKTGTEVEEVQVEAGGAAEEEQGYVVVRSPMVGTFYRSPAPDKPPYVEEGQEVKKGDYLCIIEAMKLMNEIESPVAGRVVKILVDNAQPVEYNEPLFYIDPKL